MAPLPLLEDILELALLWPRSTAGILPSTLLSVPPAAPRGNGRSSGAPSCTATGLQRPEGRGQRHVLSPPHYQHSLLTCGFPGYKEKTA